MPWVVSFASQKGGVGKSILSQGFAVSRLIAGESVVLGDLDVAQRTSFEWGEWRKAQKIQPALDVRLIDPGKMPQFGVRSVGGETHYLVLDAPGWSDENTVRLAGVSDLIVLPTSASIADLRPTIRLYQELQDKGIDQARMITALCRIHTDAEIKFARDYLSEAGAVAAQGALREQADFQRLQGQGFSVVEARGSAMRGAAVALMHSLHGTLEAGQARIKSKPMEYAPGPRSYKGQTR